MTQSPKTTEVLVRPSKGGLPFIAYCNGSAWINDAGGRYGWTAEVVAWDERFGAFTREAYTNAR